MSLLSPAEPTVMLAASRGGHLQELLALRDRFVPPWARAVWVTSSCSQTNLLTRDEIVTVQHAAPRDIAHVVANVPAVTRALLRYRPMAVVSTGAAIALTVLPLARALGIEAHYVESAARTFEPSLTGKLVSRVPGTRCYRQWRDWRKSGWAYAGSVFDRFQVVPAGDPGLAIDPSPSALRKVVVTVGTQQDYGFSRLIERLVAVLPPRADVFWQVREQDAEPFGLEAHPFVSADELSSRMADADVVVAHAGIGSALTALEAGKCPVLVPRESRFHEHVDDHQQLIASELDRAGLAVVRRVNELGLDDLLLASGRRVGTVRAPLLALGGSLGTAALAAAA